MDTLANLVEARIVKIRERIGGTIITDLYKCKDGRFVAYSSYARDKAERIVGKADGKNEEEAVRLSRNELKIEWKKQKKT
ncbi:hypothetical protein [Niallia sp. 03133]|uniref:hypothetical protein n=1 Tax=Niallia sp. 03133 TaxID=3458060 RepID=UPI0040444A1C